MRSCKVDRERYVLPASMLMLLLLLPMAAGLELSQRRANMTVSDYEAMISAGGRELSPAEREFLQKLGPEFLDEIPDEIIEMIANEELVIDDEMIGRIKPGAIDKETVRNLSSDDIRDLISGKPPAEIVLQNTDILREELTDDFERTKISPLLSLIIGNQRANIYMADKFFVCLETSRTHYEGLRKEECHPESIRIVISKESIESLAQRSISDELEKDEIPLFLLAEYEQGRILVEPVGFWNRMKVNGAGYVGKGLFGVARMLGRA